MLLRYGSLFVLFYNEGQYGTSGDKLLYLHLLIRAERAGKGPESSDVGLVQVLSPLGKQSQLVNTIQWGGHLNIFIQIKLVIPDASEGLDTKVTAPMRK